MRKGLAFCIVMWPRDELNEPAIVFRKSPFSSTIYPQNLSPTRRAGAARPGRLPRARLAARSLAALQCFQCTCRSTGRLACLNCATAALFGCSEETQTTLRRHPCCDAHGRLRECPSVRSPREWRASGDRNMPKPIIPNPPASSRCAPIAETARTAKLG